MELTTTFYTSDEEAAFEAESSKVSTGDRKQDVKDIWFAARDYFTQDRAETATEGGIDVSPDYFDERRAQVRLEILKGCHGSSGDLVIENAKKIEAWVFGEK